MPELPMRSAAIVPGEVTACTIPDLTHTLRRQAGAPSLGAYRRELRESVDPELLDLVVTWCRQRAGLAADTPV